MHVGLPLFDSLGPQAVSELGAHAWGESVLSSAGENVSRGIGKWSLDRLLWYLLSELMLASGKHPLVGVRNHLCNNLF